MQNIPLIAFGGTLGAQYSMRFIWRNNLYIRIEIEAQAGEIDISHHSEPVK